MSYCGPSYLIRPSLKEQSSTYFVLTHAEGKFCKVKFIIIALNITPVSYTGPLIIATPNLIFDKTSTELKPILAVTTNVSHLENEIIVDTRSSTRFDLSFITAEATTRPLRCSGMIALTYEPIML